MAGGGEGAERGSAAPRLGSVDLRRAEQAQTLAGLLRAGALVLAGMVLLSPLGGLDLRSDLAMYGTGLVLHLGFYLALRRRMERPNASSATRVIAVSHCVTYLLWITLVLALYEGGLRAPAAFVYPPLILMTGLVWSGRAAIGMALAVSASSAALVWLEHRGLLPNARGLTSLVGLWLLQTACVVITAVILNYALMTIKRSMIETLRQESLRAEERLRFENRLLQAQRLEALGRLAGGVAHDFNNLLTVILGNTDLLKPRVDDDGAVQEIKTAAQRAADLTRQLLVFGRRQVLTAAVVDLNEVLGALSPILRRLLPEDVVLSLALGDGRLPIATDRPQLEQVVMNLVANARDAMPHGGTIAVATATATPPALASEPDVLTDAIWITVRDDGAGMSADVQSHLFEPFFTTKAAARGTGLGLATVHGVVTQVGGRIHVQSKIGRGTSFFIAFPRAEAAAGAARDTSRAIAPVRASHATVLLVEDDPAVRNVTSSILTGAGYRVLVSRDGQEARRISDRFVGTIDLLFTDVVMAGMSGPRIAATLRERRAALKVLFTSGHAEDLIAKRGVLLPGVNFLSKPYTREALIEKVDAVLRSSQLGELGIDLSRSDSQELARRAP
jgi:signal transduction histidine kinase/FixJ family two-component response regulator